MATCYVVGDRSHCGQSVNLTALSLPDGLQPAALLGIYRGLDFRNLPTGFVAGTITGAAARVLDSQLSEY